MFFARPFDLMCLHRQVVVIALLAVTVACGGGDTANTPGANSLITSKSASIIKAPLEVQTPLDGVQTSRRALQFAVGQTTATVPAVSAGVFHSLALKSDGTVWAWGYGRNGRLGNNSIATTAIPVQVVGPGGTGLLTGVTGIAAGDTHSLALKSDGTVWAWGHGGVGQLGNNSAADSSIPVEVVGPGGTGLLTGVIGISAGSGFSLALKSDGTVWGWGDNEFVQFGMGNNSSYAIPVQVVGPGGTGVMTGVTEIAAGAEHSLALKSDGTVWAWGYGFNGRLGNNSIATTAIPVQVVGHGGIGVLTGVTGIAAGQGHSLALRTDGTVWAWGHGGNGGLGNNSTINSSVPVQVVGPGGVGFLNLGVTTPPAPSVQLVQQRPAIQTLQPITSSFTVLTPTKRHAVVLTHGWQSGLAPFARTHLSFLGSADLVV